MYIRIFNHYVQSSYVLLAMLEFTVLVVCAYVLVAPSAVPAQGFGSFALDRLSLYYALVYAVVMLLSTYAMGVYSAGVMEGFGGMMIRGVVSYCLLGASAMAVFHYVIPELYIGHDALFGAVVLSLALVLMLRWVFYSVIDLAHLKKRILVLGAGSRAKAIVDTFKKEPLRSSEIIGFIRSDSETCKIDQKWLLNPDEGMKSLVDKYRIDEIVVAADERRRDKGSFFPLDDLLDCKLTGTRITEVVAFYEREYARIELSEIHTSWMVFSDQFRYCVWRDRIKRIFDISVSLLLLALAWPFMLLTALAVCVESPGPIIYKQNRVGYRGRLFQIYKFRSMRNDAEKDGKAVWAKKNDARVTKSGAFIRNVRLDELPQLFNVFKGEMSFVGPRPERPEFVNELVKELPFYDARHRVKPGIMGWAQLKCPYGASVDDAANKLIYDLYYVKNHSLLLDLLILVQSVEVVLLGKGVR